MKRPRWLPKVPEDDNKGRIERAARVLILRPEHQATGLITACRARGLEPVPLPALTIEKSCLSIDGAPPDNGLAVFTSVNAVHYASGLGELPWPDVQAVGIGKATHAALLQAGQDTACAPAPPYTSESLVKQLLDHPPAAMRSGVTLVTGENGRTLLVEQLEAAGVNVRCVPVYRRCVPAYAPGYVTQTLEPAPDVILVPSNQALDNLLLLARQCAARLRTLPLIVNSKRAADHARASGFTGAIHVASAAGDTGQLRILDQWIHDQTKPKT